MTDRDMKHLEHIRKMLAGAALGAAKIKRPDVIVDITEDLRALTKAIHELERQKERE